MSGDIVQQKGHRLTNGNSAGNIEYITPLQADFLKARMEDVRPYVKEKWAVGIDYNSLFGDSQVLVLGDTDHGQHSVLGGLESEMQSMKKAGVNDIAFEMPDSQKYVESLELFYATGDVSHIREISEQTRTPVRLIKFLKRAYDEEVRVNFVDLSEEDYDPCWNDEQKYEQRGVYMGKRIADIAKQSEGRVVAFVGYAHLEDKQIPDQLDEQGVSYKKLGLVSAGQPAHMFPAHTFWGMGASEAVRCEGLQDKVGTVYLDSAYGLDAFIHFSRVQLVDPNGKRVSGTPLLEASAGASPSERAIVPLQSGVNLPAILFDMRHMVEPSAHKWEENNNRKIFQFVDSMNGLSGGQKLYLGIMLENYVRLTMDHGGGSICRMEYDPEARAFGIDTVDTCGYPMEPDGDYGSLARHREVTLDTLLSQFGFSELAVSKVEDLPKTNVRPNPDKPESAYKLLLLASTYATDPERIMFKSVWRRMNSVIVVDKDKTSYIVKLGVDDFDLSDVEAKLSEINDQMKVVHNLSEDICGAILRAQDEAPGYRFIYKKALNTMSRLLMGSVYRKIDDFRTGFTERILTARGKLEYLGNESALEYLTKTEEAFGEAVRALEEIDGLSSKHKQLHEGEFDRTGNAYTFKEAVQRSRDLWNSLLRELSEIRELIPPERTISPQLEENLSLSQLIK